jgi:hypothetical protein
MSFFYLEACHRRLELLQTMLAWQDDTPNLLKKVLCMCSDQNKNTCSTGTTYLRCRQSWTFLEPNSGFRRQLTNKHFNLSHICSVKPRPELYFVTTKFQKGRPEWPRGQRRGSAAASLLVMQV